MLLGRLPASVEKVCYNKNMSEQEPTNESEPILSFEEFVALDELGRQRYRNFFMHFGRGMGGEFYRQAEHYKKFAAEQPDLAESLYEKMKAVSQSSNTAKALKPLDAELYEAYKIMKSYGASDEELFT